MNFILRYERAIAEVEQWTRTKREREMSLKQHYADQKLDSLSVQALVDKDQLVQEAELLRTRAIAKAAAYGPGAILEQLRSMR